MHTIVLATQKGGSGKSTLAIGLALAAMQDGHRVRLIEAGAQGTLTNWQARRAVTEPRVEPVASGDDIEQRLQIFERNGVTLTIIDTAGGANAITTSAIRHADLVLIPARPSPADIEATAPTLGLARAWRKPFAFILNQTPPNGRRIGNAATTLGDEAALDVSEILAQPRVVMRNDHQDALGAGLAVSEFAPAGKSAEEIRGLWKWVENKLNPATIIDEQPVGVHIPEPQPLVYLPTLTEATAAVA